MKKRIDAKDVSVGMYIAELDRPWLETPFLFQGFEILTESDVKELQQFCKYVYIDVERSMPLPAEPAINTIKAKQKIPKKKSPAPKTFELPKLRVLETEPAYEPDAKKIEFEILKKSAAPQAPQTYVDQTGLEEEIQMVRKTYDYAKETVQTLWEDAQHGRDIKLDAARRVVIDMAESAIRNPDALMCLAQLRRKDHYTAEHSLRVTVLALTFARHLGFDRVQMNLLGIGSLMHDVGKMKIPSEILLKPAELTQKEARIMEHHVPLGVKILESTDIPAESIEVARRHHERYNGTGYSLGLKGDAIGQFGMIGAITDFFDALTSDRPYRGGQPAHIILRDMYKARNKLFHGEMVEQFIQCLGVYPIGSVVELNTGDVGVVTTNNRVRRLRPKVALVLNQDNQPYKKLKIIDLVNDRTTSGSIYEISTVCVPEKYGINPTRYLPVAKTA